MTTEVMSIDQESTIFNTTNQENEELEVVIMNNFSLGFKRLESSSSIESNDIYFKRESSISHENSKKEEENRFIQNNQNNSGFILENPNVAFQMLKDPNYSCEDDLEGEKNDLKNEFNSSVFGRCGMNNSNGASVPDPGEDGKVIILKDNSETVIKKGVKKQTIDVKGKKINGKVEETEKSTIKKYKRGKRGPYKKKSKLIIKANTNDKCFPFTTANCLLNGNNINSRLKQGINTIFRTNVYITDSDGNVKKQKKKRKYKADDIRKKIKVRFHKKLKNIINENLKKAGSTELFSFLPQFFLGNISKKFNHQYMNSTFEDLLSINFSDFQKEYSNKECDLNKFLKNKKTLEYLKENEEISRISGFDKIRKMKYKDLLKAYFASSEFDNSIEQLKKEKENDEYIQEYFFLAQDYIGYFTVLDGF